MRNVFNTLASRTFSQPYETYGYDQSQSDEIRHI